MFSSKKMDWATPKDLFKRLDDRFHFTLDVCASDWNAKCPKYFSEQVNGLAQDWSGEVCFMNPPYGREISTWMKKAYLESLKGTKIVCLTFVRSDTRWWWDWVQGKAKVEFIKGRVKFEQQDGQKGSATFPSCLIIYDTSHYIQQSERSI